VEKCGTPGSKRSLARSRWKVYRCDSGLPSRNDSWCASGRRGAKQPFPLNRSSSFVDTCNCKGRPHWLRLATLSIPFFLLILVRAETISCDNDSASLAWFRWVYGSGAWSLLFPCTCCMLQAFFEGDHVPNSEGCLIGLPGLLVLVIDMFQGHLPCLAFCCQCICTVFIVLASIF
jgi:hypothetical protein